MFPAIWDFLKMPYYEFIVVKEPELMVQWNEYHAMNEVTKIPGVYPSVKYPNHAFHVLKSHIPYKKGVKSIVFFGTKNALNRTGPHQYYPLEDYDVLTEVFDEPQERMVLNDEGEPVIDKTTNKPLTEFFSPLRYVTLAVASLADFYNSGADHKIQAEPKNQWEMLLPYIGYICAVILIIYVVSVLSGHPIVGK